MEKSKEPILIEHSERSTSAGVWGNNNVDNGRDCLAERKPVCDMRGCDMGSNSGSKGYT